MRIVGGKYKGRRFSPPKKFPSRPTTDYAKESLFNILENRFYIEDLKVLDLFAGTGNIGMEFLSRGAHNVLSIDKHPVSFKFMLKSLEDLGDDNWQVLRKDAFTFLEQIEEKYDLIFADPPFGLKQIEKVISLVFERGLLNEGGVLIIEHGQENDFGNKTHFKEIRKYGGVNFSFFQED